MGQIFGFEIPFIPQSVLDPIIKRISDLLAPIIKPITGAVNLFFNFKELTVGTWEIIEKGTEDAIAAYRLLHEFNVNFDKDAKHRVVETVRAYQQIRRLAIDIPIEIWSRIQKLASDSLRIFRPGAAAAEEATAAMREIEGVQELEKALKLGATKIGSQLAKVVGKAFEIIGFIQFFLEQLHDVAVDMQTIISDLREEIEKINRLNFIFLPQDNKREKVKLEDGSTIYRRIPKSGPSHGG